MLFPVSYSRALLLAHPVDISLALPGAQLV